MAQRKVTRSNSSELLQQVKETQEFFFGEGSGSPNTGLMYDFTWANEVVRVLAEQWGIPLTPEEAGQAIDIVQHVYREGIGSGERVVGWLRAHLVLEAFASTLEG